jgi:hypothetical protein
MDQSARFALPFLAPGQMQKETFHNEALQAIDMLLCPIVEGLPVQLPPISAAIGSCYLVGADADGAWLGQDGALACMTDGGWRYISSTEGLSVLDRATGEVIVHRNGNWEAGIVRAQEVRIDDQVVLRNRQPAIAAPAGGSIMDNECRAAVAAILTTLRVHGLIA